LVVMGGIQIAMDGPLWLIAIQVYAILDEVFLAGEIEETSKQVVLTRLEHLDKLD
jgi:AP-2 complex subunit sigma-1